MVKLGTVDEKITKNLLNKGRSLNMSLSAVSHESSINDLTFESD